MAAIPNGDKNGKKSSVMNGLIEKLQLQDIIKNAKLKTQSNNLEDIYSELYSRPEYKEITVELEKRLYNYFASLELPDEPTVYDFLILSLTDNDVIATFNWDPLLLQAYQRCYIITDNLPHILCLHGNVSMGYCSKDCEYGMTNAQCPICEELFSPTKLLFPVKNKDYTDNEYIKACWEAVEQSVEESYMLTFFGYSAPSSDVEAIKLLKKAWGNLEDRDLEEVSIIDIVEEKLIQDRWKGFIYSHHYNYTNDFFSSYLGMFPRRTCETIFATYQCNIAHDTDRGFKAGMSWEDIEEFLCDLLMEELYTPKDTNYKLYYIKDGQFPK